MNSAGLPSNWDLTGRVCLITGATAGIGRETALVLARLGAELVLVGRNPSKVTRIARAVQRIAPGSHPRGLVADLSSLDEVRRLADRVLESTPRLHVLINNAGVATMDRRESVDGLELQFAVNHLAPFLLTHLLLPRLVESAPSRVVTVASQVERSGTIDFEDLQSRKHYDGTRAYRQSKLSNILFTRELGRRVSGMGVTPISVHPGVYSTRLLDDLKGWSRLVTRLRGRGLPGPALGALVLARAAAAPELEDRVGVHLHEHEVVEPSEQARNPVLAERLWRESERLAGIREEGRARDDAVAWN